MSGHNLPITPAPVFTPLAFMQKWLPKLADNEFENIVEETFRELVLDFFGTFPTFNGLTVKNVKGATYPVPFIDSLDSIPAAYRILGMQAMARNGTDSATGGAGLIAEPVYFQLIRDSAGPINALIDEELNTTTTVRARWVKVSGSDEDKVNSFPEFEQEDRTPSYQPGDRFSFTFPGGQKRLFQVRVAQGYLAALPTGEDNDPNYAPFAPLNSNSGARSFEELSGEPLKNEALVNLLAKYAKLSGANFTGDIFTYGPKAENDNRVLTLGEGRNLVNGNSWKDEVRVMLDAIPSGNLATAGLPVAQGLQLLEGDRVALNLNSALTGIYVAKNTGWVRSEDANTKGEMMRATFFVNEGTYALDGNGNPRRFTATLSATGTFGTSAFSFTESTGAANYGAGVGLSLDSTTFNLLAATAATLGGIRVGAGLAITAQGILSVLPTAISSVTGLQAALDALATLQPTTEQTATYTLTASDGFKLVPVNVSSATTVYVPDDATTPMPLGTVINVMQTGANAVTIAALNTNIVVRQPDNQYKTGKRWAEVSLYKLAANTWVLSGYTSL